MVLFYNVISCVPFVHIFSVTLRKLIVYSYEKFCENSRKKYVATGLVFNVDRVWRSWRSKTIWCRGTWSNNTALTDPTVHIILKYAVFFSYGLAVLLAFVFYKKYSHTYLRFFPWLLLYVFVNELFAAYCVHKIFHNNVVMYNIYNIIFFLYFYFVFYKNEQRKQYKKWIVVASVSFMLASLINPFYKSFLEEPQLLAYIVGACVLIFCIIVYFIEILYTPQILIVKRDLLFWVSIGLLLFHVGYIPIKVTRHFFAQADNNFLTLLVVHRILILLMNTSFIIGFLWTRKK